MAVLYTWHKDKEFEEAITAYQDKHNPSLLESWTGKQKSISNIKQIEEILHHLFVIGQPYFVQNTSDVFCKLFDKIEWTDLNVECYLSYVGKGEISPNVWFESPGEFKKLFCSYEKAFCTKDLYIYNKELKTVSDHFSGRNLDTLEGFWRSVANLHRNAKIQSKNHHNLIPNVELWLTKVPRSKEFVAPYCLPIKEEVNFSHIAYAYLNNGFEIDNDILHLYPTSYPEKIEIFKKSSDYCELNGSLNVSTNSTTKRIKL